MYFIPALKSCAGTKKQEDIEFFLEIFSSVQQSIMSLKVFMSEVHFRESTNDSQLKVLFFVF